MDTDPIKNEVSQSSIYRKFNSFQNFNVKDNHLDEVLLKLKNLHNNLESIEDPYRRKIITRALNDVFAEEQSDKDGFFKLHPNVVEELYRIDDHNYPRYMFYRYRYEIFPQTKELDDYPPCLQVEPSSICNYRCVFCYQTDDGFSGKKSPHMGVMPLDLFKKVIDEAQGHIEAITIASRGEPLLNRGFRKMLEYIEGKFLATKINSNASLLTEKVAHAILESDVQTLVYSADAADPELYGKLRVRGDLETVLKNVRRFKEIKESQYPESKLITRVSGVKVSQSQNLESMVDVWGDLVDQIAFVAYNPWENTYERDLSAVETPCTDLWRRSFIWWNGVANPCDVDYKSVLETGNSKSLTLKEMWASDRYNALRQSHLHGTRHKNFPCNRCTVI